MLALSISLWVGSHLHLMLKKLARRLSYTEIETLWNTKADVFQRTKMWGSLPHPWDCWWWDQCREQGCGHEKQGAVPLRSPPEPGTGHSSFQIQATIAHQITSPFLSNLTMDQVPQCSQQRVPIESYLLFPGTLTHICTNARAHMRLAPYEEHFVYVCSFLSHNNPTRSGLGSVPRTREAQRLTWVTRHAYKWRGAGLKACECS